MKIKLSDFVVQFLQSAGIRHVFFVSGGASIHLLHSAHNTSGIEPICVHHEQAGAMAADAYSRATGNLGCAAATSGPGATNMITGINGCWTDSVPAIFISGQVAKSRLKGDSKIRGFGFQETDIVPMVRPITKYAVQILDPTKIRYELEKAIYLAKEGRPGPVLLDIPDDLQRAIIETDDLLSFSPPKPHIFGRPHPSEIAYLAEYLHQAKHPILVFGAGIRLAKATKEAIELAEAWQIPVMTSWGAKDIIPADHPLNAGTFGADGTRAGNFTIQNSDCILAIGARLSTRETGADLQTWAREAKLIVVDIDQAELDKFKTHGRELDLAICADARNALISFMAIGTPDWSDWHHRIATWKRDYPVCTPAMRQETSINPYVLMEAISELAPDNAQFFIDTGCAISWSMQALRLKPQQRTFHDFNNTAMGWALPAAIGGALAMSEKPIVCIVGDGSFMMNCQEMATVRRHNLPIKIILLDNGGYSMVRQTEDQWLEGVNVGTSIESGLGFPDFCELARSFQITAMPVETSAMLPKMLKILFGEHGPFLLDVVIPHNKRVQPKVSLGYGIEDGAPYLQREEFLRNMIVRPMQVSLNHKDSE